MEHGAILPTDLDHARALDAGDELASFRSRFAVDEPELIYLDGNSLGRLPKAAAGLAREIVDQHWGRRLIRGWNDGWFGLSARLGAKIARLLGAQPDEVIVADSTSVNLFKLALSALRARPGTIITDELNFPTDLYILKSAAELLGRSVKVVPSPDGLTIPDEHIIEAIDSETALVALSHTAYKSGYVYDLPGITAAAQRAGAWILWDLSHSVGAMPLELSAAGVDLAVGCTYKYLNGGPGAPAFVYVRRELQEELRNPIAGWFGQKDQFGFAADYEPSPGVRRFLSGTPPVLSLALIEPGVDLLLEAGLECIRAKSIALTEYLIALWERLLRPLGYRLNSPREASRRGSHVSFGHDDAWGIVRALIEEMHVIPDFRQPDTIRLGVCPLSTTFVEVHAAARALQRVVEEQRWEKYRSARLEVT